MVIKYINS